VAAASFECVAEVDAIATNSNRGRAVPALLFTWDTAWVLLPARRCWCRPPSAPGNERPRHRSGSGRHGQGGGEGDQTAWFRHIAPRLSIVRR